jgi:glyoxylase-like metal-dependent hydrolase (beta-lactamase superfamily II)
MPACRFEQLTDHVDRFTPDDRTDRPNLGAIHGHGGTLLVDGGASPAHLGAFADELAARGRPPVVTVALTHWHWDHSFGSAALHVPVVAHVETARELAAQAAYDWSDGALAARVADGTEIPFCADMIRLELPDRSDLRIVTPHETFAERRVFELGGVEAVVEHVGGDHAADSCVVHVPGEGVLFLGDCLYACLHASEPFLTTANVCALVSRVRSYDAHLAVEGHADEIDDAAAHAARLAELEHAVALVDQHGPAATAHAGADEDLAELVGFLLASGPRS